MRIAVVVFLTLWLSLAALSVDSQILQSTGVYPRPFTRELSLGTNGSDVYIAQHFLSRSSHVPHDLVDRWQWFSFDKHVAQAVRLFQKGNKLDGTSVIDARTAQKLLNLHSEDGYHDTLDARDMPAGYKYKIHVPVHRDRRIETVATLYDRNMKPMHRFIVRAKGQNDATLRTPLNEFTTNGNTPTGLAELDLNSPMTDHKSYGPYPFNRVTAGLNGNFGFLSKNAPGKGIRTGILLHTGQWDRWDPSKPMPDSHGCLHAHPDDIKQVWQILVNRLNVTVHPNTNGRLPYPYTPQGLLSVELVD